MTYDEVIEYFGSAYKVTKALKISPNTPRNWRLIGYIPIEMQVRLEVYTNGELLAEYGEVCRIKGYKSRENMEE